MGLRSRIKVRREVGREEETPVVERHKTTKEEVDQMMKEVENEERGQESEIETTSDEGNVVKQMIFEKKKILNDEKEKLNRVERAIKQYCNEIEALEYIASGEPTMTIMAMIDMFQDFIRDANQFKTPKEIVEELQKTVLQSTIDSIKP